MISKPAQATNCRCPAPTTTSETGRLASEPEVEKTRHVRTIPPELPQDMRGGAPQGVEEIDGCGLSLHRRIIVWHLL